MTKNNGQRIICKHKRKEFAETATERKVDDPSKLQKLAEAEAIADEWVTDMRLTHVLDKRPGIGLEGTRTVIAAMLEDIKREGAGEIEWSQQAEKAVTQRTAQMFKKRVTLVTG